MKDPGPGPDYTRKIRNKVRQFWMWCVLAVCFAVGSVYLCIARFMHPSWEIPSSIVLFAIGGIWLLIDMLDAASFRTPLPPGYREPTPGEEERLGALIAGITATAGLRRPSRLHIGSGIEAGLFCRPNILSVLRRPHYELVIGEMLLNILSDEELTTVLYHEFGHYLKGSLEKKTPCYVVAQFCRSFITVGKMEKPGVLKNAVKSQKALFQTIASHMCLRIESYYRRLSLEEEYAADNVAVEQMGAPMLGRTLVKVTVIDSLYRYYLNMVDTEPGCQVRNDDLVWLLTRLADSVKCDIKCLPRQIVKRLSRIGWTGDEVHAPITIGTGTPEPHTVGTLMRLRRNYPRYAAALALRKSVKVRISLEPRSHRLPLVDGYYQVVMDGRAVGIGNYRKGYVMDVRTSPGSHTVEAYALTGVTTEPLVMKCEPGESWEVEMDYRVSLISGYYHVYGARAIRKFTH